MVTKKYHLWVKYSFKYVVYGVQLRVHRILYSVTWNKLIIQNMAGHWAHKILARGSTLSTQRIVFGSPNQLGFTLNPAGSIWHWEHNCGFLELSKIDSSLVEFQSSLHSALYRSLLADWNSTTLCGAPEARSCPSPLWSSPQSSSL